MPVERSSSGHIALPHGDRYQACLSWRHVQITELVLRETPWLLLLSTARVVLILTSRFQGLALADAASPCICSSSNLGCHHDQPDVVDGCPRSDNQAKPSQAKERQLESEAGAGLSRCGWCRFFQIAATFILHHIKLQDKECGGTEMRFGYLIPRYTLELASLK